MTSISTSLLGSIALAAFTATPSLLAHPAAEQGSVRPDAASASGEGIPGEALPPSAFGRSWVESMEDVVRRDQANPAPPGIRLIPEPENPREREIEREKELAEAEGESGGGQQNLGGGGSPPTVGTNFIGPAIGSPGGGWVPPDTCGAVGINHFVSVVNANLSVWNKATGVRQLNVSQTSFWGVGGSLGDGRAVFDPHSQRFILLTEDFSSRIYLAVSTTSDPTGSWFKTSFVTNGGTDVGTWPDYPTLGVDANGIYTAMYQVGGANSMTIFAIDKAPMISATPSLGTVTAFRGRPWEGAIHPCVTYGNPGVEYLVSRVSGSQLRVVRVFPPLTAPTISPLANTNFSTGVSTSSPPNATQLGGGTLDTLDGRLMNAVYRNGTVWTAHAVNVGGRSGCRWYQINPTLPPTTAQTGSVDDPLLHYFFPGVAVNSNGAMVVGFSGSSATQFAGVYVSGRKPTDPAGQTAAPILVKSGETANNDGRFGDYSLTSIDPTDDLTFWTIQEYGRGGSWGTWITKVQYDTCNLVPPSSFCVTSPNTAGPGATMFNAGTTRISQNDFVIQAFGLPPNKTCIFLFGMNQSVSVPFGNGTRCIANPFFRLPVTQSNTFGDAERVVDLNNLPQNLQFQAGDSWGFQCWYRDPQAPGATTNVSDGLSTTWCP